MNKKQKQRLAIAADVIAQLKAETLIARSGIYVSGDAIQYAEIGDDLQKILRKELTAAQPCEVCAMGACFISTVRLYDDFTVSRRNVSTEFSEIRTVALKAKVATIFSRREMGVIESCFEGRGSWLTTRQDRELFGADPAYGDTRLASDAPVYRHFLRSLEVNDRLIFLMKVVIANPKRSLTMQIVKDTLLQFFIEGAYKDERATLRL